MARKTRKRSSSRPVRSRGGYSRRSGSTRARARGRRTGAPRTLRLEVAVVPQQLVAGPVPNRAGQMASAEHGKKHF